VLDGRELARVDEAGRPVFADGGELC
jgi:hypothetical protein